MARLLRLEYTGGFYHLHLTSVSRIRKQHVKKIDLTPFAEKAFPICWLYGNMEGGDKK
jgi:hypothetical protein